ncbi:MAG: calcium/sodium antiporter [Kiritimatiellae bacterium]|nr:calcium/sodium antiporter [Kiritimatiellia bacterium]
MDFVLPLLAIAAGLALLVRSADAFVDGAAGLARGLGAPAFVVGMVVVGFGTSAPEMAVSTIGALRGSSSIALGNAYGSNICNIALILGLCAAFRPLAVSRSARRFAIPALVGATLFSLAAAIDGVFGAGFSRTDSFALLLLFAVALFFTVKDAAQADAAECAADAVAAQERAVRNEKREGRSALLRDAAKTAGGVIVLVASSRILVWGAVEVAHALGVSDLVIGLTVIAVGTSLPELASSVAAVRRAEDDLAVGNIVGSNLFNTLAVVGVAGAITPMPEIERMVVVRDLPASLALALFLAAASWFGRKSGNPAALIGRKSGIVLLAFYTLYICFLTVGATSR